MKKHLLALGLAAALSGCAGGTGSWVTLVDGGKGMENFDKFRDANWHVQDGAIVADKGGKEPAYLVSKKSYGDFDIRVEFWASDDANSGIFLRCQNPKDVGDENCYEANIFDQRPDPTHGTAAIVKVGAVQTPYPKAGGKWNVMEVTARGNRLVVVFNGQQTVDVISTRNHMSGPIALQWGRGVIKFRKVQIREL